MKRLMLVGLALLMLVVVAYADQVQIPAPFAKAKEMAMTVEPDIHGRYLIRIEFNESGTDFVYMIGYLPDYNLIGIGNLGEGWVAEFNTETGKMTVWTPMGRFPVSDKEVPVAIDRAFEVFRVLVAKRLI